MGTATVKPIWISIVGELLVAHAGNDTFATCEITIRATINATVALVATNAHSRALIVHHARGTHVDDGGMHAPINAMFHIHAPLRIIAIDNTLNAVSNPPSSHGVGSKNDELCADPAVIATALAINSKTHNHIDHCGGAPRRRFAHTRARRRILAIISFFLFPRLREHGRTAFLTCERTNTRHTHIA